MAGLLDLMWYGGTELPQNLSGKVTGWLGSQYDRYAPKPVKDAVSAYLDTNDPNIDRVIEEGAQSMGPFGSMLGAAALTPRMLKRAHDAATAAKVVKGAGKVGTKVDDAVRGAKGLLSAADAAAPAVHTKGLLGGVPASMENMGAKPSIIKGYEHLFPGVHTAVTKDGPIIQQQIIDRLKEEFASRGIRTSKGEIASTGSAYLDVYDPRAGSGLKSKSVQVRLANHPGNGNELTRPTIEFNHAKDFHVGPSIDLILRALDDIEGEGIGLTWKGGKASHPDYNIQWLPTRRPGRPPLSYQGNGGDDATTY